MDWRSVVGGRRTATYTSEKALTSCQKMFSRRDTIETASIKRERFQQEVNLVRGGCESATHRQRYRISRSYPVGRIDIDKMTLAPLEPHKHERPPVLGWHGRICIWACKIRRVHIQGLKTPYELGKKREQVGGNSATERTTPTSSSPLLQTSGKGGKPYNE